MKPAAILACIVLALSLYTCEPDDTHSMWSCWCDVSAEDHSGTFNFPFWCDDGHDRYDNGALMVSYCWTYMTIWWDPGTFTCDCDCVEVEATTQECVSSVIGP